MNGKPLKIFMGQDAGEETPATPPATNGKMTMQQFMLTLVPFTPVPFTGDKSAFAWMRLGLYGIGAAVAFDRFRRISYLLMGAAAVSAASSFAANAWNKSNSQATAQPQPQPVDQEQ